MDLSLNPQHSQFSLIFFDVLDFTGKRYETVLLKIAPKTGNFAESITNNKICGIRNSLRKSKTIIIYMFSKMKLSWNPQLQVEFANCKRNPHKFAESTLLMRNPLLFAESGITSYVRFLRNLQQN